MARHLLFDRNANFTIAKIKRSIFLFYDTPKRGVIIELFQQNQL